MVLFDQLLNVLSLLYVVGLFIFCFAYGFFYCIHFLHYHILLFLYFLYGYNYFTHCNTECIEKHCHFVLLWVILLLGMVRLVHVGVL